MDEVKYLYTDHDYIPVPRYAVGQVVFVISSFGKRDHIDKKLIRVVNRPRWLEGNEFCQSHWVVDYRYQDIMGDKPWGRMHTEYTLREENIYSTEEEATIALAQRFIEDTRRAAAQLASQFKRLGIPMNASMLQLSAPENQKQE